MNYTFLKGAIHIHTKFSDGSGDIDEITKSAEKAGLDWIIITDHNTISVKEGIYNNVIVLTGEEITPETGSHYLALNIKEVVLPSDNPLKYIQEVRNQNGFGFTAHPDENINRKNNFPPLIWTDKNISGDGIEIWNWFSSWADNVNNSNIFYLIYSYFFRHKLIKGPYEATLNRWDEMNNKTDKIFPAVAGIDAHALAVKKYIIPLKIFSYDVMLGTLCNVLYYNGGLSCRSFEDKKQFILNSVKSGGNLMINRHILKDIPEIYIKNSSRTAHPGAYVKLDDNTYIFIKTVKTALIRIFLNGKKYKEITGKNINVKITETGKYRAEIFYKNQPWAFSNPIAVY